MHRLFIALRPPPSVRALLLALAEGVPGARWQDDEQVHLTLRFIGAVERPVAEDVAEALSGVRAPAPEAALAGVGRFERKGRTDALWAGLAPNPALAALHRKVDQACIRAGLAPERRAYLPHVTLARFSRSAGGSSEIAQWLSRHGGLASPGFRFENLILYESHLAGEGARYEPVMRWRLD